MFVLFIHWFPITVGRSNGDIRLLASDGVTTDVSSGIVEFFYDGRWGMVCDSFMFGTSEASTVCDQLGLEDDEVSVLSDDRQVQYINRTCGQLFLLYSIAFESWDTGILITNNIPLKVVFFVFLRSLPMNSVLFSAVSWKMRVV